MSSDKIEALDRVYERALAAEIRVMYDPKLNREEKRKRIRAIVGKMHAEMDAIAPESAERDVCGEVMEECYRDIHALEDELQDVPDPFVPPTAEQVVREAVDAALEVWHSERTSTESKAARIRKLVRRAHDRLDEIDPALMALIRRRRTADEDD